jgi:hypothetical protein
MMNQMMFFMPIMFGYITLGLPAGLTLYWTVSNILSMVQQYFVAGWGGLVDWLALISRMLPGEQTKTMTVISTPEAKTPSSAPERPVKRNRRRR